MMPQLCLNLDAGVDISILGIHGVDDNSFVELIVR